MPCLFLIFNFISILFGCGVSQNATDLPSIEINTENTKLDSNSPEFIPTHEWQEILPGQAVPPGLHYRLNLQNGKREAKLLEPDLEHDESAALTVSSSNVQTSDVQSTPAPTPSPAPDDRDRSNANLLKYRDYIDKKKKQEPSRDDLRNIKQIIAQKRLEHAFKSLSSEPGAPSSSSENSSVDSSSSSSDFRKIDELHKEFNAANMSISTDYELLVRLVAELKNVSTLDEQRVAILKDLEFLLHQLDNALDVVQLGGIELLVSTISNSVPIYKLSTSSSAPLDSAAATRLEMGSVALQALGAACASNPGVQITALEANALHPLLELLNTSYTDAAGDSDSGTIESSTSSSSNSTELSAELELRQQTANGALFALGALLRQFPYAQQRFVELSGLRTLTDLLRRTRTRVAPIARRHAHAPATAPALRRTMLRTLTLAHDLIAERELHYATMNASIDDHREKLRQYDWVPLRVLLVRDGWCEELGAVLSDVASEEGAHDTIERLLAAIELLASPSAHPSVSEDDVRSGATCRATLKPLATILTRFERIYSELERADAGDASESSSYFASMHQRIAKLRKLLSPTDRDEL